MTIASTKPYLLRAIWEWCVDQGFTPYLATRVDESTRVPPGFARDGQIVLNLSPDATAQLQMGNEQITFQARFGGVAHAIVVPVANVLALYARENGEGMAFGPEEDAEDAFGDAPRAADDEPAAHRAEGELADDVLSLTSDAAAGPPAAPKTVREGDGAGDVPARPARGAHLKIVK